MRPLQAVIPLPKCLQNCCLAGLAIPTGQRGQARLSEIIESDPEVYPNSNATSWLQAVHGENCASRSFLEGSFPR